MLKFRLKHMTILTIFYLVLITSLWSNNIYLLVLFAFLTFITLPLKKFWDGASIMLLLFSVPYSVMSLMTGQYGSGFMFLATLIAPVAFFRFGRWMMTYFVDETSRQKLLVSIIFCYLISLFIMTFKDIAIVGIVNETRVLLEGTHSDTNLAATMYGMMASVGIGCVSVIFITKYNIWHKLANIVLTILSMLVVVHLLNRTGILIFMCCTLISLVLSLKMRLSRAVNVLIIVGIVSFLLINLGIITDDIFAAYQQRELDSTVSAQTLGGRSFIWNDAVNKLLTHPFGWEKEQYAHNLWLDIARIGGWVPLLFFLCVTFDWVKSCYRLVHRKKSPLVLLIVMINLSMLMASFVEPVIDASILFFVIFMMFWGFTKTMSKERY